MFLLGFDAKTHRRGAVVAVNDVLHKIVAPLVKGKAAKENGVQNDGTRPNVHLLHSQNTAHDLPQ